jgi:hypothetical protein
MLIVEFCKQLTSGKNEIRYRNTNEIEWQYMYVDVETLHLLLLNFGVNATTYYPTETLNKPYICVDNPSTTSDPVNVSYCGASIEFKCGKSFKI